MKKEQLEKLLLVKAEEEAKVSSRLHQDIMTAVRLAKPAARKAPTDWRIPALGTAMSLLINTPLTALEEQLAALSQHTLIPEKELKAELERLKSDLKRFDLRS